MRLPIPPSSQSQRQRRLSETSKTWNKQWSGQWKAASPEGFFDFWKKMDSCSSLKRLKKAESGLTANWRKSGTIFVTKFKLEQRAGKVGRIWGKRAVFLRVFFHAKGISCFTKGILIFTMFLVGILIPRSRWSSFQLKTVEGSLSCVKSFSKARRAIWNDSRLSQTVPNVIKGEIISHHSLRDCSIKMLFLNRGFSSD